jgi:diguanylate cyclase
VPFVHLESSTLAVILVASLAQCAMVLILGALLMRRKPTATAGQPSVAEVLVEIQQVAQQRSGDEAVATPLLEEISKAVRGGSNSRDAMLGAITQAIQISQLKGKLAHAEQQLEDQARRIEFHVAESRVDPLTTLANRRALDEELTRRFSETKRTGHRFCVMLVDIDHFKRFNDSFGHHAGDQALRQVSTILRATMREMDLIARYGGEEFAIVLPATDLSQGRCAAERARTGFERATFEIDGKPQTITVSIGLAEAMKDETISLLLRRADASLYAAKAHGRNATFCHESGELKRVSAPSSEPVAAQSTDALLPSLPEVEDDRQLELVAT